MKVVSHAELLEYPAGTLYCDFEPCIFGELSIFQGRVSESPEGGSVGDFFTETLVAIPSSDDVDFADQCFAMYEKGLEIPLEGHMSRCGLFDSNRRFVVFSANDLALLLRKILHNLEILGASV